jgi:hypothetical protein
MRRAISNMLQSLGWRIRWLGEGMVDFGWRMHEKLEKEKNK